MSTFEDMTAGTSWDVVWKLNATEICRF